MSDDSQQSSALSSNPRNSCPDCKNHFEQPFVCITCGAQKLYNETVRTQAAEIERLRAAFAVARDNVLNGRGPLEAVLDGDQTNAVLAVLDEARISVETSVATSNQVLSKWGKHRLDCPTFGCMECEIRAEIERLERELSAKQAHIDRLMMEYCPDEITGVQLEEWEKHQVANPLPDVEASARIPIGPPPCFFCSHDLEQHYRNRQGHPWREGSSVTMADLARADDWTREVWIKANEHAYQRLSEKASELQESGAPRGEAGDRAGSQVSPLRGDEFEYCIKFGGGHRAGVECVEKAPGDPS